MARPRRYTAAQMIEALTESQGMVYLAAQRLGCDPDTVGRYCQRYPSVQAVREAQRGLLLDTAESQLWQAVEQGEAWAIQFCLRTIGRDRGYSEKLEHVGSEERPVLIKVVYEGEKPGDMPS